MNKKIYKMPSIKMAQLESTDILFIQESGAKAFEEEVDPKKKPEEISEDIWGKPW